MLEHLAKMITVSVICLSPAIAWATFWNGWKERRDDVLSRRRNQLKEVLRELDIISNWASSKYDSSAHSDEWYNPYFHVRPFPSDKIKDFNWREDTSLFGEEIFDKLNPLERAIDRFLDLLMQHNGYSNSLDSSFMNRIVHKISEEKRRTCRDAVDPLKIQGENKLTSDEIICVKRFYELNKAIHVQGIGTEKDPDGLHSTFHKALKYVKNRLEGLKPETPFTIWAGHILAIIVGFIGVFFLICFFVKIFYR